MHAHCTISHTVVFYRKEWEAVEEETGVILLLDNDDGGNVIALGDPIRMIPIIGSSNNDLVMNRAEEQFNHRSRYLGPRGHCAGSGGRRDGGDNAEPRLEWHRW